MSRMGREKVAATRRDEAEEEDGKKYLRKADEQQRSQSVSPEVRTRIKSATPGPSTSSKDAGAVDEEHFRQAFLDWKKAAFSTGSEVEKGLMEIHTLLSNSSLDWEKRVDELKRFRGYIAGGAADYKEFFVAMRYMDMALQVSVKDLRSQVVREACISIAFLASTLGMRCERSAEMLLPTLILLIPNSAKVMSSSGVVAIRLLLTYVHSPKLIPIITQECLASKSKETRRACCEFVRICLSTFPKSVLDRHVASLRETIKKSMSDADSEARALARQAFSAFAVIFPAQGGDLFRELDLPKQRLLNEAGGSSSSTMSHGAQTPVTPVSFKARPVLKSTTTEDLGKTMRMPMRVPPRTAAYVSPAMRSISAVDAGAARRARANFLPHTSHVDASSSSSSSSAVKPSFLRGSAAPLQRSIRKDVVEKRQLPLPSWQKRPIGGLVAGMERLNIDAGGEADGVDHSHVSQVVTDIPGIVALLGSSNMLTKRDGLLNLSQYFLQGKTLLPSELELLRSSYARLLTDPSTKLAGIVMDTLYDFIRIHNLQIGSWLYQLLTKLWARQAFDVVPSVNSKVDRLFILIRSSFPAEVQFQHVMRYLTELTQASPAKQKLAVLNYLTALIRTGCMQSEDLKNTSVTRVGLAKVIGWSDDSRFPLDLRQSCQTILVLLNQLSSKTFVEIIDTLEQDTQKLAIRMISNYQHVPSAGGGEEANQAKNTRLAPLQGSVLKESAVRTDASQVRKVAPANDENINPATRGAAGRNGSSSSIPHRNVNVVPSLAGAVSPLPDGIQDNAEEQIHYLTNWSARFTASTKRQQCQLLEHLHSVLHVIKEDVWEEHFMTVLPFLYDLLHNAIEDSEITSGTLVCFADLLRLQPEQMRYFPELTIVNLLEVQHNASKAVTKACEECLKLVIQVFPCDVIVKILGPVIANQPAPENAAAVQFFALMCRETENKASLIPTLPQIIPLLASAYAHSEESTMRKECVYGLIYAQLSVGEDLMAPYYQDLPQSKLRLMNVYLKRIVQS